MVGRQVVLLKIVCLLMRWSFGLAAMVRDRARGYEGTVRRTACRFGGGGPRARRALLSSMLTMASHRSFTAAALSVRSATATPAPPPSPPPRDTFLLLLGFAAGLRGRPNPPFS